MSYFSGHKLKETGVLGEEGQRQPCLGLSWRLLGPFQPVSRRSPPFSNLGPKMSQKVGAEAVLLKYLSQHPAKVFMFGYHPEFQFEPKHMVAYEF